MVNTKTSLASVSLTGGGITPYESPSCEVIRINVSGPLCQSLDTLSDPNVNFGDDLDLGVGIDL